MSLFRRPYTQTDARAALRTVMANAIPPITSCDSRTGEPWDTPDGREQMDNPRLKPRTLAEWQRRHGKRTA